jgi:hypothetical protein
MRDTSSRKFEDVKRRDLVRQKESVVVVACMRS